MFGRKWNLTNTSELEPATQRHLRWDVDASKLPNGDDFFDYHFDQLYSETFRVCHKFFGVVNFHEHRSPWAHNFSDEFYNYVESIAHPDILMGGWDGMLRNKEEREMLACGIVAKVLDAQVFSNLLFGAEPEHQKKLDEQDRVLLDLEGFTRTRIRADMNQRYLSETGGEPFLFWDEVDRVAVQLLSLLMPLYKLVANKRRDQMPPRSELYQALHDIVAHAGYIGARTRISTSIYLYHWRKPGAAVDDADEVACRSSFEASRGRAEEHDVQPGLPLDVWGRIPRYKISVRPLVTRHTPVDGEEGPGVATYRLQRALGVVYMGWRDMDKAKAEFVSLKTHVWLATKRTGTVPQTITLLFLGLLIWLGLWFNQTGRCPATTAFSTLQEQWRGGVFTEMHGSSGTDLMAVD